MCLFPGVSWGVRDYSGKSGGPWWPEKGYWDHLGNHARMVFLRGVWTKGPIETETAGDDAEAAVGWLPAAIPAELVAQP